METTTLVASAACAAGRDRPGGAAVTPARCAKPRIGSRSRARSGAPLTERSAAEAATLALAPERIPLG